MYRLLMMVQELGEGGGVVREWPHWTADGEEAAVYTAAMGLRNYLEGYLGLRAETAVRTRRPEDEDAEALFVGVVAVPRLNVRNGPGTLFDVLYSVEYEDPVEVFEVIGHEDGGSDVWYRIGLDEWVSARYVAVDEREMEEAGGVVVSLPVVLRGAAAAGDEAVG
jgi:hypothetical protein